MSEERITNLEIKLSFTEDLIEKLNETVYKQQQQIEFLYRELKAIKDGGGSVTLKTVSGGSLVASVKAGKVILTDEKGGVATVVATDLGASNGLIHVIDTVVLPK
jgi:SlyX protein